VKRDFAERFMLKGFGLGARLVRFEARVLAGSKQDGTPREQLVVMPHIASQTKAWTRL
jgi:hypothetical protein